jgi:hypothetical protein
VRLGAIFAGLIFAALAAVPASANTIANFQLSGVTFDDGGTASGGDSVEHTEASFGEDEGVAISDASGGNHNLSAKSK